MSSELPSALPTNASFATKFDQLIEAYVKQSNADNMGLVTYFDKDWLSPCVQNNSEYEQDQEVSWRPYLRLEPASLRNLEEALEISIPAALQDLFCRYYSHDINASAEHGNLTILQAWNQEDFDRLQKNLIAHVLMKRRLKQADTLFFALTDEDDFILSILVSTGAVMLEKVGQEPHREIAANLVEFMANLKPLPLLVTL